jgi:hypothetical protein
VWRIKHPKTKFDVKNQNKSVSLMIAHVLSRNDLPQPNDEARIIAPDKAAPICERYDNGMNI